MQRTALAAASFLPAALWALTDTGAPAWIGIVVALFIGTTFGILIMCRLNASGPCAQDALLHLGRLYRRMVGPLDSPPIVRGGAVDNARLFLQRWGEGEGS